MGLTAITSRMCVLWVIAGIAGVHGLAYATTTCQDFLVESVYQCDATDSLGGTFPAQVTFAPAPFPPPDPFPAFPPEAFSMILDAEGVAQDFICSCTAAGSFLDPQFGEAKSYLCAGLGEGPFGPAALAFGGKAKQNFLEMDGVNGQLGVAFFLSCNRSE